MSRVTGDRHRAPHLPPATLVEAKAGLDRHRACADDCNAKRHYESAVQRMVRGRGPGWNIWPAGDRPRPV